MSFSPKDSAISVTKSLEEKINSASSTLEIQALLHQAALDQKLIEPDPFDRIGNDYFSMHVVETPQPRGFAKSLIVDGIKHIIEGATEADLVANELALMRTLFAGNASAGQTQPRGTDGKFVSQADIEAEAARVAALNADPTAEIEADLVERALAARGIKMETLRQLEGQNLQKSWHSAVEEFKRGAGQDWAGGKNMEIAVQLIEEKGLSDKPSAETLAAVWEHMKKNNLVVENTELTQERKRTDAINGATDYESLKAAVGYRDPDPRSSGMWGSKQ